MTTTTTDHVPYSGMFTTSGNTIIYNSAPTMDDFQKLMKNLLEQGTSLREIPFEKPIDMTDEDWEDYLNRHGK